MSCSVDIFIGEVIGEDGIISNLRQLLSLSEIKKADSFRFKTDSNCYVYAHGMLRKIVSENIQSPPELLKISSDEYGKPYLENNRIIKFSLSHTKGFVAIAITRYREVGVDIEKKVPMDNLNNIANKIMSNQEFLEFKTLDLINRIEFFFRCWVRKEAVVKAWGMGINDELNDIDVVGNGVGSFQKEIIVYGKRDQKPWVVKDIELNREYVGAVCLEGSALQVKMYNL